MGFARGGHFLETILFKLLVLNSRALFAPSLVAAFGVRLNLIVQHSWLWGNERLPWQGHHLKLRFVLIRSLLQEGSKEGLLNLLEFATGKSRDFKLRGSLRCYNRLGLWVKDL